MLTPLAESRVDRACSDRLALNEVNWLGEPECLYVETLAWLGG